jgi:hypothetical protein
MALHGCLQIILIIAVAFLGLYLLQNMSGRRATSMNFRENFGGQDFSPSRYDVSPNQDLANRLNMPRGCGCQGPCDCSFVPPPPQQCNKDYSFGPAPTCPTQVVNQCGDSAMYPQGGQDLAQASCFPRSQLTPDDLLPTNECNVWSKSNPYGSGSLADRNFLQAGWATGVSTVGSVMKNPNLQLRSEFPNPQVSVSPWMQTSIEPDLERKPLEVGGCQ